ncbi:MAG: ThiF family adenylyltransferase [Legionellales bacterium]
MSLHTQNNSHNKRYTKQIKLEGFGVEAQEKLLNARVLIIGAGGLGCPAITYLASAGVGTIGIMDHDRIEETNLHRQPLYSYKDIGKPKVQVAGERARMLNPEAKILEFREKITPQNALDIIKDFDLLLDCTDNYEARYLINDSCILLDKPWIYGAVEAWEGQLSVFNLIRPDGSKTASYRCIFPEASENALNCNDIGVIGTLPGTIGLLQANEAIKILTGIGEIQSGLLLVDLLHNNFQKITVKRNNTAIAGITKLKMSYGADCNIVIDDEITFEQVVADRDRYFIIDIRDRNEIDTVGFEMSDAQVPMHSLIQDGFPFKENLSYVLVCASGKRSAATVSKLKTTYPKLLFYSLKGGVMANSTLIK